MTIIPSFLDTIDTNNMHDRIRLKAVVYEINKGGNFFLHLQDDEEHKITAKLCGKMRIGRIVLCVGDLVDVELSPYDLHKGRIMWRH